LLHEDLPPLSLLFILSLLAIVDALVPKLLVVATPCPLVALLQPTPLLPSYS